MITNPFYIYALKDSREHNAKAFYIGKGHGARRFDHWTPDTTPKGVKIKEIQDAGGKVVTTILADDLTEQQALKLEAELISAFGTIKTGGTLLNSVIPTGHRKTTKSNISAPSGTIEKAQIGLTLLQEAVLELAKANPIGITNSDCVKALYLSTNYLGGSKDYLTWSILGLLMQAGKMERVPNTKRHIARVR